MPDILKELYEIIEQRKAEQEDGSYTVYLFKEGLDKILKKLGEEAAETIIAAKNLEICETPELREALKNEVSDMIYHIVVMLNELGVDPEEIEELLRSRMLKRNNLKETHRTGL